MTIDFKFDACLHREPPEVGGVKGLTGSLYWWVEQCVPSLHSDHEKSQLNCSVWGSLHSPNKSVSLASLLCYSIFGLYLNYNNLLLQSYHANLEPWKRVIDY